MVDKASELAQEILDGWIKECQSKRAAEDEMGDLDTLLVNIIATIKDNDLEDEDFAYAAEIIAHELF